MKEDSLAKPILAQPRAKWFTSMEDLIKAFEKFKTKEETSNLIPVVFHHTPMSTKGKDTAILMVHPQTTISIIVKLFQNMVRSKYKQQKQQRVYIFYRHKRYLLSAVDNKTVEEEYNRSKGEDGFLHINYYFQGQCFYGPTGGQLALIILALPLLVAFEGTKAVYSWTAKAATNITKPLRLFSFQQGYKFKDTYSLQQRRSKQKQFTSIHPNNVMIIVQKHQKSKLPDLPFIKFLAKNQIIYGQLTSLLQNRIRAAGTSDKNLQKQSVFFSINNKIPDRETNLAEIYQKYKHQDNIVYVTYQEQQTF